MADLCDTRPCLAPVCATPNTRTLFAVSASSVWFLLSSTSSPMREKSPASGPGWRPWYHPLSHTGGNRQPLVNQCTIGDRASRQVYQCMVFIRRPDKLPGTSSRRCMLSLRVRGGKGRRSLQVGMVSGAPGDDGPVSTLPPHHLVLLLTFAAGPEPNFKQEPKDGVARCRPKSSGAPSGNHSPWPVRCAKSIQSLV